MKSKFILNDMIIVHEFLGIIRLQMKFRDTENGKDFTWQMPFNLGESIYVQLDNLRRLESGIAKTAIEFDK